jgi:hypothetical protein
LVEERGRHWNISLEEMGCRLSLSGIFHPNKS